MKVERKRHSGLSWGVIFLCCTLVLTFFAGYTSLRLLFSEVFRPRLVSKRNFQPIEVISGDNYGAPTISIRETVIFPEQAVLFLKHTPSSTSDLFTKDDISCIYLSANKSQPQRELSPSWIDYDHQIVRCDVPPRGMILSLHDKRFKGHLSPAPTYRWVDALAYEAMIDRWDNTTVVFVKGLNLRSGRVADPSKFKCLYGWDLTKPNLVLWADVVSAAQEIVRCKTPSGVLKNMSRLHDDDDQIKVSVRVIGRRTINSVARVKQQQQHPLQDHKPVHDTCICTMLRNQAQFLSEWVMYHDRIGVQRWFIYDNNSDDDIESLVKMLVSANYNVTRHSWPWIKTQEAGFAHCAMRTRELCKWVAFMDVDEFFHLPAGFSSLHDVVSNRSMPSDVGEIRVPCLSFGPSGLKQVPKQGVMAGYTCRLALPERHKSIVRPEALNSSLINMVHHFHLHSRFRHLNMNRSTLVINHYKYQVWEVFKEKFYRRVATYVSDWQLERNVGSKDRAPGLGTKAVEPSDWSRKFCEVKDTGLRDRVLETFTDPLTGRLPWEKNKP